MMRATLANFFIADATLFIFFVSFKELESLKEENEALRTENRCLKNHGSLEKNCLKSMICIT